jgi:hypothetical protein
MYTVQILENSRTEIFSHLIFLPARGFLASEIGKGHKGRDLANKESEEARLPFPVSDIFVQWPLILTKHCHTTT